MGTILLDKRGHILVEFCHEGKPSMLLTTFRSFRSFVVHCVTNVQEGER